MSHGSKDLKPQMDIKSENRGKGLKNISIFMNLIYFEEGIEFKIDLIQYKV